MSDDMSQEGEPQGELPPNEVVLNELRALGKEDDHIEVEGMVITLDDRPQTENVVVEVEDLETRRKTTEFEIDRLGLVGVKVDFAELLIGEERITYPYEIRLRDHNVRGKDREKFVNQARIIVNWIRQVKESGHYTPPPISVVPK